MKFIDLCNKFNVKEIPNTLKEVELDEDINNITDFVSEDKFFVFSGSYNPLWYDGDEDLEVVIELDLSSFSDELLRNIEDMSGLSVEEYEDIVTYETLIVMKMMRDNFYAISGYNLLGELILIS